ncbi:hypothetical protein AB0A05_38445 [Streptomyces sp. NPDC046374]|uniref:hypothetical protein n=1 Tax=Streptomyces sp. NPDC046374 TaxID=3154917 RepID=UPI0033E0BE3F
MEDAAHPSRVIVGIPDNQPQHETHLHTIWSPCIEAGVDLTVTRPETAELAKSAANGFLATKISYINFIAALCEKTGADDRALARFMSLDPRIGPAMLDAGLGFGSSCVPKDIRALHERATELGVGAYGNAYGWARFRLLR